MKIRLGVDDFVATLLFRLFIFAIVMVPVWFLGWEWIIWAFGGWAIAEFADWLHRTLVAALKEDHTSEA